MKKLHYCLPAALASLMIVLTCSCDGSAVDITDEGQEKPSDGQEPGTPDEGGEGDTGDNVFEVSSVEELEALTGVVRGNTFYGRFRNNHFSLTSVSSRPDVDSCLDEIEEVAAAAGPEWKTNN